jgi:spore coat polysaccharide biosynthesis protein SpsF (cytidylyltransferase family)
LKVVEEELRHPEIRLVVDYLEDFELIKEIYDRLYKEEKIISLKEVMGLLKDHPELLEINKKAQEMYEANIKNAPEPKFKNQK